MTNKELEELVLGQAKEIASLKDKVAALEAANTPKKATKATPVKTPTETFKYDKKEYRFTVPKYIGSQSVTVLAKDALKNPAELERLVLIKAGIIELVK